MFYGPDPMLAELVRTVRWGLAPMPGAPSIFTSSLSHDDAATAVVASLDARAGEYNVVDDEPLRRDEYFGSLAAALGAAPPHFLPGWTTPLFGAVGRMLSRSLRISNRKFRSETAWAPRYRSVREGWGPTLAEMGIR